MTNEEARKLQAGDEVCSPDDTPSWKPRRVTEVHVSPITGIVRVRIAAMGALAWRPVDNFVRAPGNGAFFDTRRARWMRGGNDCTPRRSDVKHNPDSLEQHDGASEPASHPEGDEQDRA